MILSLYEVAELKKDVEDKFSIKIHFHDACGGQHFTIENPTDELKKYIVSYFSKRNLNVLFSKNGTSFLIDRKL